MDKVAIIGYGIVGQAYHKVFPDAVIFDPYKGYKKKKEVNKCDLAIICVPTPTNEEGCDFSIVEKTVKWLETEYIVIKSTIAPGTTDYLSFKYKKYLCFSPEYIGESVYYIPEKYLDKNDPRKHPFQIFGGNNTEEIVKIFSKRLGPTVKYIQTSATIAELAKYMENCFFATKIIFCNEFAKIANKFNVDYNKLREVWLNDPRINPMHTLVYGGFGGKCLPKDLKAIIKISKDQGYEPKLLKQVLNSNKQFYENWNINISN